MTEYIVRSRSRIFGPFYNPQEAIDWVEQVRVTMPSAETPLGVEMLEDPAVRVPPPPRGRALEDDDIAF